MGTVWRSVKGKDLQVGMHMRAGDVVTRVVDLVTIPEARVDGYVWHDSYRVCLTRRVIGGGGEPWRFTVDESGTPYRVLFSAPLTHGGSPVLD